MGVLLGAAAAGCSVGASTGPSVKLKEAPREADEAKSVAAEVTGANEPVKATGDATAESGSGGEKPAISPRLGFIKEGGPIALDNGGRVPLGDDKLAEVFLSPYPPDWQTDLHLFLLKKGSFEPVTDVDLDLLYEMVYMDHGVDGAIASRMADGHYVMPLSFQMYGDWKVDVTLNLPEGKKHLVFIVKFFPVKR